MLHNDADGPDMMPDFHFHSVIGKLNFLEKSTRPDISISVHQCTQFTEHPKQCHAEAVKRIGRFLLGTRGKGLIINPKTTWHFDCWVDAEYAGNWRYHNASLDPMTAKSRSGLTEFRQPLQVQIHLEMSAVLVQLGHIQRT